MFEAAFALAPNGVAMIGLDGRFLRVNDALCAMLGRTEAELVGHPTIEVCHPDDLGATHGAYEAMNTASQPVSIEKRYLRPDGEVVWAFCRGTRRARRERRAELHRHALRRLHRAQARRAPRGAGRAALRARLLRRADRHGARRPRRRLPEGQPLAARDHGLFRAGAPGPHPPGDHASRGPRGRPRGGRGAARRADRPLRARAGLLRRPRTADLDQARALAGARRRRPARALHRPRRGHLGAQAHGGLAAAPRRPRSADRSVEPPAVRGGAAPPGGALPALRREGRAAAHGPRRLQGRQRHLRPQGRRRPAQARGRRAAAPPARHRCRGATGRRRVRGPARQRLTRPGGRARRAAARAGRRARPSSSPAIRSA